MFALTTLVYPLLLAVLCVGAGLLVDRCSGRFLPACLLPTVGAAALIALSQLFTFAPALAPATPFAMAALAAVGLALGSQRLLTLAQRLPGAAWQLVAPVLAYLLALAPVLLAGRPSFSSYLTLSDSAVHMTGADFLLRHGQHYSHLDLRNSYGLYIHNYYDTYYPSGSDTLFGASAFTLGLPLIWAFQPFNAFMLALAACPAWLLMRRVGLAGGWASLAALSATIPALVYGYELIGSIKEITSLGMILSLGALIVIHRRWLGGRATGAIPFALVAAAGISALGVGFGVWILASAVILAVALLAAIAVQPRRARRALGLLGVGALVALLAALPTWSQASGSLKVAQDIASTKNPGNLLKPLQAAQLLGVWLWGSYKTPPQGGDLTATNVLLAITLLAVALGVLGLIRRRDYALSGWIALVLLVWLALSIDSTTWVDAKTLMLTSPVVAVLAWGGVATLQDSVLRRAAAVLALALAGGVLASDAMQYHSANLAPTARYEELATIDHRFAGRGPVLFTDFDEYSLYVLRDLDVGGPDFIYGPPALLGPGGEYRYPVELDRLAPQALSAYPLIVTRLDPSSPRPPSAYSLLWRGDYYEVWGRGRRARAAIADVALPGPLAAQCVRIERLAGLAREKDADLIAARSPELVRIDLLETSRPRSWGRTRDGLNMSTPGRLSGTFLLPRAGRWDVWLQGQIMPTIGVELDGHRLPSLGAQLDGNSLVLNTLTPLPVSLSAGSHRISLLRGGFTLAPGNDGSATLYALLLAPTDAPAVAPLDTAAPGRWRSLCARSHEWVEVVRS